MKTLFIWLLVALSSFSPIFGMSVRAGDMIGSGGFGLTISPTTVLLSPELEWVYNEDINFGGLVQMGFGGASLVTTSGKARWTFAPHSKYHPSVETGLGLAFGSGLTSSVGVHIFFGAGFDYLLTKDTSIGTMFRINFAPPVDGMFISWPMIVGRFRL